MIRFVHCVKRRDEVSELEFRRFWNGAEYLALIEEMRAILKPVRLQRSLVLSVHANEELMRERQGAEPFDAMLELWFDNAREFVHLRESPGYPAFNDRMEKLLEGFVDFSRSARFFTEWDG